MKIIQKTLLLFGMILCFFGMQTCAEEAEIQITEVSSFVTPFMQEITVSEKETLEDVKRYLPETLEAMTAEQEMILVPVSWECAGDFDHTAYYYYQFQPVIDFEVYELAEDVELPYIWVLRASSDSMSRAVTSAQNETRIYQFLTDELECNLATAVGILANIERESSYNPKAAVKSGEEILYYGICQWGGSRLTDLRNYCKSKGYGEDTLEGQLSFLKYELQGKEASAWKKMQGIENSAEGAYLAGYNWARYFERCATVYREVSAVRARDVYWPQYAKEHAASVYRIAGSTRYETGIKIANQLKKTLKVDKFENVIIATGKDFADAMSGSYLAYVKNAPILLTNGKNTKELVKYIQNNLKNNGTIYLLGGKKVVSEQFETLLEGLRVKRLAGDTRYETNLLILKEAGTPAGNLLVCTGKDFADSLSASAAGKPILLVSKNLKELQKEYLSSLKLENIYIIGGENAVSEEVFVSMENYGKCIRVSGDTRYETSIRVAETFFEAPKSAILAYSKNFPDGLCGGVLAAKSNAPLILTKTTSEKAARSYVKKESCEEGFVLGGSSLISDDSVKKIFNIASDKIINSIDD